MPYATEEILQALRTARDDAGLSQRDLSARIGLPQSHISKIENGGTDLRLSSLVQLARALGHEVVLVPRKLLPAVEAMVGDSSSAARRRIAQQQQGLPETPRPAYTLDDADGDEDA